MTLSKTITDSEGEDIEVFTAEELEQSKSEGMESLQKELEEVKTKREELQKQLDGELDKDKNFSNLRKQKQEAEERAINLESQIDEKVNSAKNEILEAAVKNHYNEQLNELVGEDEELKKKIEYQYNRIKDTASTKEEVSKKLRDSWTLATVNERSEVPSSAFSSGGASRIRSKTQNTFTTEEKALARKLASAGGLQLEESDFNA